MVNVFNMWQELEHYIGCRVTGTGAGNFALVGLSVLLVTANLLGRRTHDPQPAG